MKMKSQKEIADFVKAVKRNDTWEGLAKEIGVTAKEARFMVYGIRAALGAEACPLLERAAKLKKRQKAIELRRLGIHSATIAKRIGVSTATVCRWMREEFGEGWQEKVPRHASYEDERRTKEIVKLSETLSYDAVGKMFGVSRQRVHQIVKRAEQRAA